MSCSVIIWAKIVGAGKKGKDKNTLWLKIIGKKLAHFNI